MTNKIEEKLKRKNEKLCVSKQRHKPNSKKNITENEKHLQAIKDKLPNHFNQKEKTIACFLLIELANIYLEIR